MKNKCTSKTLHYQIWAADISSSKMGLKSPWEKNWVVSFNATKTFHHQRSGPDHSSPVALNRYFLRQLKLKLAQPLSGIRKIAKYAVSLYNSSKILNSLTILYIYKCHIRSKVE